MKADWDPHGPDVLTNQRPAYDAMRSHCPVGRDSSGDWTLFRHADVTRVLHDHDTFSSVASPHLSVPNGMDPPAHTDYRHLVERCFEADRVAAFEPACRRMAAAVLDEVLDRPDVDLMAAAAWPFAARALCAYLGWSESLAETLIDWTRRNQEATLERDHRGLAAIASDFEALVADVIASRDPDAPGPAADLTDMLLRETVGGRRLTQAELTSILRNWTMGDVGTLAAAIGIVAHALASEVELQCQLRRHLRLVPDAIDELLRIHGPLVSSRRRVTRQAELGGRTLEAGSRLTINWIAANRDPNVFNRPDRFRLDRDPGANLLYGAGIHVCPGAPLARLELRVIVEELLAATHVIEPAAALPATLAMPPASGYSTLPLCLISAG